MATDRNKRANGIHTMTSEKRGGYGSSSKVVTKLAPPPKGKGPGAQPTAGTAGGSK